jgi:uncharacterized membrane protein YcaP (DUF421 family)
MGWVYNVTPEVEAVSQYRLILGVCLSLTILMAITVSLRMFVRAQVSRLAAADYVMVVSMVSVYVESTTVISNFEQTFAIIYSALCISREY